VVFQDIAGKSKAGDSIEQGVQNEDQVIAVLPKYVNSFSGGVFSVSQKVREYGLLVWRDCNSCATTPDGVFQLLKKENCIEKRSLCVLEMKTRGAVATVDEVECRTFESSRWVVVMAGTDEFKRSIPEPAYQSQVCQHAAATGIEYVLMVYAAPGALIKQMVLVYVTENQQMKLVDLQSQVTSEYLSFAYQESGV
jgi:hypothetical protein